MTVLLFARAKELVGRDRIEIEGPATVGELRERLLEEFPMLAGLLATSAFAVNSEYALDATPIPANAEVALLPPVSGG